MRVRVVSAFGVATLQDAGRAGYRGFGVPPGGAFDRESFWLANALLGNERDAACIEFALGTLEMEVLERGSLAFVGAASGVVVNGSDLGTNLRTHVLEGDTVVVSPPKSGLRTYVAMPGGVFAHVVLGSVSGQVVDAGDELASVSEPMTAGTQHLASPPESVTARRLRVVVNDEDDSWCGAEYEVGRNIDRVGLRLEGAKPMVDARSGVSEPSVFGAVQVTEDRTLIVHGPDGPTIGGYRKLGGVVRADLDRLGQLAPGDRVSFVAVTRVDALSAWDETISRREETLGKIALAISGAR